MDSITRSERKRIMSLVKSKDTRPELIVRRAIHGAGFRYRLHAKELPGCPDIVFPSRHKVIFVHGCFWHRHTCRNGKRLPKSRVKFWRRKLVGNKNRDRRTMAALRKCGWSALAIWECQIASETKLLKRILKFLGRSAPP